MVDPALFGIVSLVATPFIGGAFAFFTAWLTKRSDRKIADRQAEAEENGTAAQTWQQRVEAIENRADEREKESKRELKELDDKVQRLEETVREFNERWRVVTSTLSQLLWQIAQQWPPGSPHPVLAAHLIAVLERYGIADLIPAVFRSDLTQNPKE